MSLTSVLFFLFLAVAVVLYWIVPSRFRNLLLLVLSSLFYASFGWRDLLLLWTLILFDFFCAQKIEDSKGLKRKVLLAANLGLNFSVLFIFKIALYLQSKAWLDTDTWIYPVGLSFYLFQKAGYMMDVERGRFRASRNWIEYGLFVSFFPILLAGPIEQARHLIGQIRTKRTMDSERFLTAISWLAVGAFYKLVLADNLTSYHALFFQEARPNAFLVTWISGQMGVLKFYCDFVGYSCIAFGAGALFGFNLTINFHRPYLSRDPMDFWRRWHVSLTRWFVYYIFRPLARTRKLAWLGDRQIAIALLLTFILIGLWHATGFGYLTWALANGFLYLAYAIAYRKIPKLRQWRETLTFRWIGGFIWFNLWTLSCFFLVSKNFSDVAQYARNFTLGWGEIANDKVITYLCLIALVFGFELLQEWRGWEVPFATAPRWVRWTGVVFFYVMIVFCGSISQQDFFYFNV